jgi:hypothetical protein
LGASAVGSSRIPALADHHDNVGGRQEGLTVLGGEQRRFEEQDIDEITRRAH